jgi:AraC-like DNA-binding protein
VTEIVRADALRGFRELASELGGDGDALLRASGIDPAVLADGDTYISYRNVMQVVERAAAALKAPDFGLRMAALTGAGMLGPLSVAMHNAETVRDAISLAQRFFHFHNPSVLFTIGERDAETYLITLDVRMRRAPRHPQTYERGLATVHGFLQTVCGKAYKPKEIAFKHAPLSPLSVYRAVFGITPVFNAPAAGVAVSRELLDTTQLGHNAQIRRIAEHFLETAAPLAVANDAIAPRARLIIARLMHAGPVTQADLASAFGLHERTLQRRLKAEDTSFEALRDDVRRDLAREHLAQGAVPLGHIAEMLGYAEASAFTRACQRWFGASPREYRRQMAG